MKDTFYFSHDYHARADIKIAKLLQKGGWQAYGLYWAIIEMLYENDGYLQKDYDCIAYDLRTDAETVKRVIEEYDLFKLEGDFLFSKSVLHRLRKRKGKSEQARQNAKKRWGSPKQGYADALPLECQGNAIKESKVKENKEKNTSKEVLPEGSQMMIIQEEIKPDKRNTEINFLIEEIKRVCTECHIIYDKHMEREFARHILNAKSFGEFCDQFGKSRVTMALEIIVISCKNPYTRGVCNGPKSIYQKYPKIINTAIRNEMIEQGDKKDPNNLQI